MTQQKQIYKCAICGNIIEVLHAGAGELVCCGQPMNLMEAKTQDQGQEKHLPVIEETPEGIKVKIGAVEHPMEEKHYIEWIEINTVGGQSEKKFLKPGDKPEAVFRAKSAIESARAYCNVHGLWIKIIEK
jgi:superoxide reductase